MNELKPGVYVVAVSGGVDSVAILNMLSKQPKLKIVVAHFNHGIRPDAYEDEKFVGSLARSHGFKFESAKGRLGQEASEDDARKARYKFLSSVKNKYKAIAIITAHHQDDLIETAIINIIRGTGRRGLSALASRPGLIRPLLNTPKIEIIKYAKKNNLVWREDITNKDTKYLRNWVRAEIMPNFKPGSPARKKILNLINENKLLNQTINPLIATLSQNIYLSPKNRQKFIKLPADVSNEVLNDLLKQHGASNVSKKMINRLTAYIKTGKAGTTTDVYGGYKIRLRTDNFTIYR